MTFAVNKFRGDTTLFANGMTAIADHTGWQPLGIVPWFDDAWRLPAEDILDIKGRPGDGLKIAVPRLRRIANFDDLDPLSAEPGVSVDLIEAGRPLPGDADVVLIPGSKSTISDLAHFREQGWDIDLHAHIRRGGHVLGVCGGYQMLGRVIDDPDGIEGPPSRVSGLGWLDIETVMTPEKCVTETNASDLSTGASITAYEIHIGKTDGPDCARGWIDVGGRTEGAASVDGRIMGCYLHGLFTSDDFRAAWLSRFGTMSEVQSYEQSVDSTLDALADHLETHLDVDKLFQLAR